MHWPRIKPGPRNRLRHDTAFRTKLTLIVFKGALRTAQSTLSVSVKPVS